jgi:hypothetical protein
MTRVRRSLLIVAASAGLMLAGAPMASSASLPVPPTVPTVLGQASPAGGLPVVGGFVASVLGIVTGTYYGIVGASSAVLCPILTPVCSTAPGR